MTLHIHSLYDYGVDTLAVLRDQLLPGVTVTVGDEVPVTTNILVAGRASREQLEASEQLRAFIVPWAGLPTATRDLLVDFPHVAVHNLHHNAAPVAELAFALLLSAAKFIVPFDQSLRRGDWTPRYESPPSLLLAGKTALILGYGAIGQRVARLCRALEMTVLATKRTVTAQTDGVAHEIHSPDALPDLLPRANALLICLPHTPETDGLIGETELAALNRPSLLVNIGRGAIVDQAALYAALRDRALHAAGLDVWYNYPPDRDARADTMPADFPFHELENVVLSPHRGGGTSETDRLRMTHLARLLNTAVRGQPMPNRVDVERGY